MQQIKYTKPNLAFQYKYVYQNMYIEMYILHTVLIYIYTLQLHRELLTFFQHTKMQYLKYWK